MNCTNIKVGDRVWLGNTNFAHKRIRQVMRLTDTQIILGVSRYDRFQRANGYQIGAGGFTEWITGVATKEEIVEYEKKLAKEKKDREDQQKESEALTLRRHQLNDLFEGCAYTSENMEGKGTWDVTFHNLTDRQVLELAEKVRKDKK